MLLLHLELLRLNNLFSNFLAILYLLRSRLIVYVKYHLTQVWLLQVRLGDVIKKFLLILGRFRFWNSRCSLLLDNWWRRDSGLKVNWSASSAPTHHAQVTVITARLCLCLLRLLWRQWLLLRWFLLRVAIPDYQVGPKQGWFALPAPILSCRLRNISGTATSSLIRRYLLLLLMGSGR